MRKTIARTHHSGPSGIQDHSWLDLDPIAEVDLTSEDPAFPIESALHAEGTGWRAAGPGDQHIRIFFDTPVSLHRIHVRFVETSADRTQQFTLGWSSSKTGPLTEIVQQQWNFSPSGATTEVEEYKVALEGVAVLELTIRPDIGGGPSVATLAAFRLA